MEFVDNWSDEPTVSQNNDNKQEEQDAPPTRLIPGHETFDDYLQEAFAAVRNGIKMSNNLPVDNNFKYYACFPSFNNIRNKNIKRILDTMQMILKATGGSSKMENRDIDDKFDLLLETNDHLLDQANILMDEESGVRQNPEVELVVSQMPKPTVNGSWNIRTNSNEGSSSSEKVRLLGGKNIQRPQLMFKDKIDNSQKPWVPRIKEKPNSLRPLALYVEENELGEVFNHPYEYELDKFEIPECQLKKSTPTPYKSLDNTKFMFIERPSDIRILLEDLKNYKEIAIDLEHHSYRTFQGITCLMQISTIDTDYIIDTLVLRSELYQLNEIFTKPQILKIFHGADMDILWLQKDLSLYIVNMFDTHQAAKQLNLPYLSLAYLLNKYCSIDPNKHFQLADWRIRPLPQELIKYAREDTHYLLYIKDILKNELIESANGKNNILKAVYDRSTDICKRTYVKPIWTEESCMNMYRKSQKVFNNKQIYALVELHKWRDSTAREEDDSIGYVLPNHMLLNIAETLPREMQGILACCNPIPPLVRQNLLKIHKIVLKAREQSFVKSIPEQDVRQRPTQQNHAVNSGISLYMPHDIPSGTEARADLPCLLDKNGASQPSMMEKKFAIKHIVTIFDILEEKKGIKNDSDRKKTLFVSPFMRYKRVIPMIAHEEEKEREKQKQKEEEEEKQLVINIETKYKTEIDESKNRVYEHFKQISQIANNEIDVSFKEKKAPNQLILGQMHGKKRKRGSDIGNQIQHKINDNDFITPVSSLDTRMAQLSTKTKQEMLESVKEQKVQPSLVEIEDDDNPEIIIKSIRARKKGEKKANEKLLGGQGMLPSKEFNYKEIDFSSFQGGSTEGNVNQTQFQEPKQKKKRYRNRKKQKFNI